MIGPANVLSQATGALWSVIAHGSDLLLMVDWQDGTRRETSWFPVGDADRFESVLAHHVELGHDPRVGLVPRRDRHPDGLAESQVLWASIENPVSVRVLNAFRPQPTLLFRKGRHRVAVWWLDKPLPMAADPKVDWLTRANRRLAYALKANSRHAAPEWLMPVLVLEDCNADRIYTARDVVGRLRDAPERKRPAVSGPPVLVLRACGP